MELVLVLLVVGVVAAFVASNRRADKRRELETAVALHSVSKVAEEDVTRFGEELQQLHIETMTTELDVAMRQDYQRALDAYEHAKQLLRDAATPADVSEVTKTLEDGRYAQACVLARQSGDPLPQRRPPCFFNPAHGPAQTDIEWAPYGGTPREIPVCLADAARIREGAEPDARLVRAGNRMVPWYEGGRAYAPYADGYYGSYAVNGLFPGFLIGAMMMGMWAPVALEDPTGGHGWDGGWDGGDSGGGGDGGGWGDFGGGDGGGDAGGWGDFGGGDFGGF
jgi:hypothetical protein